MKYRSRLMPILATAILAFAQGSRAATAQVPLKTLAGIHDLSNEEADKSYPVDFQATVTYYRNGNVDLFAQDGDKAVYIETGTDENLTVGDVVEIEGVTRGSFRPEVKSTHITVLRHGPPPPPFKANFQQLIRAELDCRRVTVRAIVRGATSVSDVGRPSTYLQLMMDGGELDAEVFGSLPADLPDLLDAEVEITGAAAGKFDTRMQMTGILLEVPLLSDLKVIHRARQSPKSIPLTPMDEILRDYDVRNQSRRVRVQGTVTYYQPGTAAVLENGPKSLWITTQYEGPIGIGESVVASGFPDVNNGFLTLTHSSIERSGVVSPETPRAVTAAELAKGTEAARLVSVEGRLLMAVREAAQDEYVLVSGNHLFSAVQRHPSRGMGGSIPPLPQIPAGAIVRMTGVCNLDKGDFYAGPVAFEILLRSPEDIRIVAHPSWVNVHNLAQLIGLLLLIVLGLGSRGWLIERGLRNRAAQMMKIEQMRGEILSKINRSHPLTEVLYEITKLAELSFQHAGCWCVMESGEEIGQRPSESSHLQVFEIPITARSGSAYGYLRVALAHGAELAVHEKSAIENAAELATAAIETSRTYSDLLKRSEFDSLTGLHNRFALEKSLETLSVLDAAQPTLRAIIYIDLDQFKQVNDTYGHHFGDSYLQEVALRMKRQIRPVDMLARLGGDEFAVVVRDVRAEEDVVDIAARLQRCFERAFEVEGQAIHGTASLGIAYYPEDGMTKESLFRAADLAMYMRKRAKHAPPALRES